MRLDRQGLRVGLRVGRRKEVRLVRSITPGGWLAIMLAAVLAAIAIRALNPWLLLVACALAVPALVSQFFRPDLRSVSVAFRSPERMVVGEPVEQVLSVRNDGRNSTPGLGVVHTCAGLAPVTLAVPPLPPGGQVEFTLSRTPVHRGHTEIHEIRLWTTAPFGMAGHARRIRREAEFVVHPARVPALEIGAGRFSIEDAVGARLSQPGTEPHGLREWRHGDDRRHVNWRATARQPRPEQLIVVVPEPEVESRLVLVVTGSAQDDDWEDLVSLAAWSACAAVGSHAEVTLLAPGVTEWTGTDEQQILDWFAGLGAEPDPGAPIVDGEEFHADVHARESAGVVVVVATTQPFGLHLMAGPAAMPGPATTPGPAAMPGPATTPGPA
ncbi:DUF58 domain-containing protein [Kineosporia sp. NBRC 101731]|uniref:DUF58 domain-containing protein n=1 Tax=Kineosporia sp. NBRC 101731 TaxID=3032199 RepID=UPI0024A1C21E|nr:DUF58 domain-containing protein [Kineosporia sp. NBRC 101731]GLY26936.1 hypothetical protein Kisp02_03010 [Kineosporia sp. NBRC 101731]